MSTQLVVFGVVAILLGVGLLSAGRRVYPRLDVTEDSLESIRYLTALIAAVLLLTGLGLVLVGLFG
ncbi:hypothetical protein [Halosolutus gelatinilyticus]|uniref:hypothetical protein n=1 Tax=Halosolutus gelatinilyticus TaxID=2931975 RepID=UPI001FF4DE71|nr:hypothetical protein [Halosolutus gelatinilyticus]